MTNAIPAFVNGKEVSLESGITLERLLKNHAISSESRGIAVAYNDQVIPRSHWKETVIQAYARIEIVHAVQGG